VIKIKQRSFSKKSVFETITMITIIVFIIFILLAITIISDNLLNNNIKEETYLRASFHSDEIKTYFQHAFKQSMMRGSYISGEEDGAGAYHKFWVSYNVFTIPTVEDSKRSIMKFTEPYIKSFEKELLNDSYSFLSVENNKIIQKIIYG